jgi:hypothetical protein
MYIPTIDRSTQVHLFFGTVSLQCRGNSCAVVEVRVRGPMWLAGGSGLLFMSSDVEKIKAWGPYIFFLGCGMGKGADVFSWAI